MTIYKSHIRPHLDYGDIIYDQPHIDSFINKVESVQYNAALAITGAIKGTSKERMYRELGFKVLQISDGFAECVHFGKLSQRYISDVFTKLPPCNSTFS